MFFEEGWASIADVTREVRIRVEAFHSERAESSGTAMVPLERIASDTALSVWEICDAATKAGVISVGGQVIPASKALLAWDDPRKPQNRHIDIRSGNVGSGIFEGEELELTKRYGQFLYLPISIPENGVESSLSFLQEEMTSDLDPSEEIRTSAAKIAQAVDGGTYMTRDIARKRFAAALSRRQFKYAWSLAADARPVLWEGEV